MRIGRTIAIVALAALGMGQSLADAPARRTHLVIVVDGLRSDYVTSDVMPRLVAMGRRGIVFKAHHSAFPTVTRVNASSIATGTYPETHGLLGTIARISCSRPRGTSEVSVTCLILN